MHSPGILPWRGNSRKGISRFQVTSLPVFCLVWPPLLQRLIWNISPTSSLRVYVPPLFIECSQKACRRPITNAWLRPCTGKPILLHLSANIRRSFALSPRMRPAFPVCPNHANMPGIFPLGWHDEAWINYLFTAVFVMCSIGNSLGCG